MPPAVHPALPRLRRDAHTVQVGLAPSNAVVLGGLHPAVADLIIRLDGRTDRRRMRVMAARGGADPRAIDQALDLLATAGVIADSPSSRGDDDTHDVEVVVAALVGARERAHAAARRDRVVDIRGAGRLGTGIAVLLAASGIGRVTLDDNEPVRPWDVAPGGLRLSDVGRPRGPAAEEAVQRAAAEHHRDGVVVQPGTPPGPPDLVVLAPASGRPRDGGAVLLRAGIRHLAVHVSEGAGTVGPLVLPGQSTCLNCIDLHRADRDPAWPRLALQAAVQSLAPTATITLAAGVVGLAAQQALAFLDGRRPATVDGSFDISFLDGRSRRRSWRPHPACGCAWG